MLQLPRGALAAMFSPRAPRPALCWYVQRVAHACATVAAPDDQVKSRSGGAGVGLAACRTAFCVTSQVCASPAGVGSGVSEPPGPLLSIPTPHAEAARSRAIDGRRRMGGKATHPWRAGRAERHSLRVRAYRRSTSPYGPVARPASVIPALRRTVPDAALSGC